MAPKIYSFQSKHYENTMQFICNTINPVHCKMCYLINLQKAQNLSSYQSSSHPSNQSCDYFQRFETFMLFPFSLFLQKKRSSWDI